MLDSSESIHDLATLVRVKAQKNGHRVALRFPGRQLTYDELDRESDRVANGLAAAGIGPGARVACLLFNTPEFPLLWFALAKRHAVLVPLNTGLKGEILRYELDDSQPQAIIVDERLWDTYSGVRDTLTLSNEWVVGAVPSTDGSRSAPMPWSGLPSDRPAPDLGPPSPWEPASILYTSGTTGPPKGAVIPHEKGLVTATEIGLRSRLSPDSVLFTALPLFHCNAQEMTTLTALLNDLTAAYDERFSASRFWGNAARLHATHVSLLISMVNVLFKQPEQDSDRSHAVRTALTAGATKQIWPEFERRFGVTIIELYGITECGCTTLMNPPDAIRVGSVGTPLGFIEAQVVDDNDRPVGAGQRGELLVRNRRPFTMFLGYHRKPEQTVEA
ncbi:MAG: AMP-binding protein, partial [Thermoplasmata archaeon]